MLNNPGKIFYEQRVSLGLSQEDVSKGICPTITITRFENGFCKIDKDTYQKLIERLNSYKQLA